MTQGEARRHTLAMHKACNFHDCMEAAAAASSSIPG